MNGRHGGISGLDRMFGRFCGGFDDHGRELSKELGYDRDHKENKMVSVECSEVAVYLMIFR